MNKQSGLTLIELLIAIIIVGILAAFAVPNFGSLVRSNQLKSSYNTFAGVIAVARSEAVNRRSTITICVSKDKSTCATGNDDTWSDGYMVFVDRDRNAVRNADATAGEDILRIEPAVTQLDISSSEFEHSISIAPRGRLRTQGSFVFCAGGNAETARALNLWVTGLGRLATDGSTDTDTIVEDISGTNVQC